MGPPCAAWTGNGGLGRLALSGYLRLLLFSGLFNTKRLEYCLPLLQIEKGDNINIKQLLLNMRKHRMGLIQTPDQLRFSYMTIIEGAKFIKGDSSIQVNRVSSVLLSGNCTPCKPQGFSPPPEKHVFINMVGPAGF